MFFALADGFTKYPGDKLKAQEYAVALLNEKYPVVKGGGAAREGLRHGQFKGGGKRGVVASYLSTLQPFRPPPPFAVACQLCIGARLRSRRFCPSTESCFYAPFGLG